MNVSDRAAGSSLEGRYRLEARLSGWGVGEVWRATDAQRPRAFVTVKLLPAPAMRRTERLSALKLLGDRLARLQHPNLLPLVEINTSGAQPFVVYESWESIGLGEWLTTARASGEPTALRTVFGIVDRTLAAIGAGHRQRSPGSLVHGAVHHEAVRVRLVEGREPDVRVLDFGLSADRDASALAALVESTPAEYGAPEHAREPMLRNPAADVFAAAVLVLRLLVPEAVRPRGHRSWSHFVSQRESEVHSAITALRADVHPSVWEALAQALSRRPEARPADAERLRELLRAASWGPPASMGHGADEALAPVVPMALPTLLPAAPSMGSLPHPDLIAVPTPPAPSLPAPSRPLGPPPVPTGMQLGVAAVLGANRPEARPRRVTAGVDQRNFGPPPPGPFDAAGPPQGHVSLDDAQATRQDISLPDGEPETYADVEMPTMAVSLPSSPHLGAASAASPIKLSLDQADRTVPSRSFEVVEHTQIAQLPVPTSAPMPSFGASGHWAAGPAQLFPTPMAGAFPTTLPLADATMPLSLDAVPPEVAAALAAYASPVNPASWDSTSNLQPVSYQAAPRPPPGFDPQPRSPADPFALVAAAGRGDARAWDTQTTPPDRAPQPARTPSTALLIGLALLAAALAFLIGVKASSGIPAAPSTAAPTAR